MIFEDDFNISPTLKTSPSSVDWWWQNFLNLTQ